LAVVNEARKRSAGIAELGLRSRRLISNAAVLDCRPVRLDRAQPSRQACRSGCMGGPRNGTRGVIAIDRALAIPNLKCSLNSRGSPKQWQQELCLVGALTGRGSCRWRNQPGGSHAADWHYCSRGCLSSPASELLRLGLFRKTVDGTRPKLRAIGLQAGHSRTCQMPPRTSARSDSTRERRPHHSVRDHDKQSRSLVGANPAADNFSRAMRR
jgi:hypothetical protein